MDDSRNYLNASFNPYTQEPICFAVWLIRQDEQEIRRLAELLGMVVEHGFKANDWIAYWDTVRGEGPDVFAAILGKLNELDWHQIRWQWCHDLVPEMEDTEGYIQNSYSHFIVALKRFQEAERG